MSERTIATLIERDGLPCCRIGRRVLFNLDQVREWALGRDPKNPLPVGSEIRN